jgi:hypothetical protein
MTFGGTVAGIGFDGSGLDEGGVSLISTQECNDQGDNQGEDLELEAVLANIRRRHPRGVAFSNARPQVHQCFIPKRHRRPDRPKIASKGLPEHLMALQLLS